MQLGWINVFLGSEFLMLTLYLITKFELASFSLQVCWTDASRILSILDTVRGTFTFSKVRHLLYNFNCYLFVSQQWDTIDFQITRMQHIQSHVCEVISHVCFVWIDINIFKWVLQQFSAALSLSRVLIRDKSYFFEKIKFKAAEVKLSWIKLQKSVSYNFHSATGHCHS